MYDSIKNKCKSGIDFYTTSTKYNNNEFQRGIAIGSINAYKNILNQINSIENYVYRKNLYKNNIKYKNFQN